VPLIPSSYRAPFYLRHGHSATLLPALLPAAAASWTRRTRLELDDGDFLDLAWSQNNQPRLAILSHGLEGSLEARYIRNQARLLQTSGWDVLAWNYRGCGGGSNRLLQSYHSGASGDLRAVVDHAARAYDSIVLVGFSLGGNITLKYLAEQPPHPAVRAGVAVSAPVDLASSALALDGRRGNRLYLRRFLSTLLAKAAEKAQRFPGQVDPAVLSKIHTIREFDEHITAPWHGFAGAADYWARASSGPLLERLTVPALLLSALDDPLLDQPSFPRTLAEDHPFLHLETPAHGGHLGFPGPSKPWQSWHPPRIGQFLETAAGV